MRRIAVLLSMTLVVTLARAEGTEPAKRKANTATRVYAATTLLNAADGGLISVGFSSLARMAPGARTFKTLHTIKGDSLYRVASGARGDVLAAWENDPSLHYFTPDGRHLRFPKPAPPREGLSGFSVQALTLLPNGRDALVHMAGAEAGKEQMTYDVTFRLSLDGRRPPEPVVQLVGARRLEMYGQRAAYVLPKKAGQRCNRESCDPVDEVIAFQFDEDGNPQRTTVVKSGELEITNAHMVWGQKDAPLVLRLDLQFNKQALATWRPGEAQAHVRPVVISNYGEPRFFALASGEVLEARVDYDEGLSVKTHLLDGGERVVAVPVLSDPDNYDHKVHAIGVRRDGRLWMQWGDHLLFFGRDPAALPRAYDLEPLLQRRQEWASVGVYVASQDVVWVGIDSHSRDFVKVDLASIERRAKPIARQAVAREAGAP